MVNSTGNVTPAPPASDEFVQSLARGLTVIRAFDEHHPKLTLTEVAQRSNLARAAARRFLLTLETLGYVRFDGREFELTGLVLELGYAFLSSQPLSQLAIPALDSLSSKTGESSSIAVLDAQDIVYVARMHRRSIMQVNIHVGTRFPAIATSMGRVLLANLPDAELEKFIRTCNIPKLTTRTKTDRGQLLKEIRLVREQGWALVDQELELGLRSIAVPITNERGQVVAALNSSMQVQSSDDTDETAKLVKKLVPLMQATATSLRHVATPQR